MNYKIAFFGDGIEKSSTCLNNYLGECENSKNELKFELFVFSNSINQKCIGNFNNFSYDIYPYSMIFDVISEIKIDLFIINTQSLLSNLSLYPDSLSEEKLYNSSILGLTIPILYALENNIKVALDVSNVKLNFDEKAQILLKSFSKKVSYIFVNDENTKNRIECLYSNVKLPKIIIYPGNINLLINFINRDYGNNDKNNTNVDLNKLKLLEVELEELKTNYEVIKKDYENISGLYIEIINSFYWRVTFPFRKITNWCKIVLKKHKITYYPFRFLKLLLTGDFKTLKSKVIKSKPIDYTRITVQRRLNEENTKFDRQIKFSILVPLFNTPELYLKQMINSVLAQTYKNWELCLVDGSDKDHINVESIVKEYCKKDKRIIYKKLQNNKGISENTNECIKMSTGDYIGLFDHDDILHPSALYENVKVINQTCSDFIYTDEATFNGGNLTEIITFHFKPDYSIDNLRANNYICHFSVFSRELLNKTGMFRSEYNGSQDHDFILRLTSNANRVYHIPKLLYFWRSHPNSVASDINSKFYAIQAGKNAVRDNIALAGYDCKVESSKAFPTIYRIKYEIKDKPLVSILIPNSNHKNDLTRCVNSILNKTTYTNYEIVIVENNSNEESIFEYYKQLNSFDNIRIIYYEGEFNYSKINNFGVNSVKGKYVILLNNDTQVISHEWIEEMLMYAQRSDVGAVGAKLYYPDNTIQHAGIIIGLGADRIAGHSHYKVPRSNVGYMGRMYYSQDVSAVTGACMLVKKETYEKVGGLDESFKVAFNDVDFCLKIRKQGYLIVFTPYAELYHYESKSRGLENTADKVNRFKEEAQYFREKWNDEVIKIGDPYYNQNLSLDTDYEIKYNKLRKECRE